MIGTRAANGEPPYLVEMTPLWKSLRLSHNHLDNCSAVTHIPTRRLLLIYKNQYHTTLGHSPKGQNSTLQPTMGWGKLLSPKLGSFTFPLTWS